MAKPELGTKRVCPVTGRKFYDLNKNPIISPYTGMVVPVAALVTTAAAARSAARAEPKDTRPDAGEELLDDEAGDVELVSLEDADQDENASGKKAPAADEDLEIEDDIPDDDDSDDDTFLEEDEEGSDVSDLIDPDLANDEEA
ncbi:TIGR02300 family protein [Terrihabitans sp. B22-R8]|uniref:TIGR02300 family protein n=1 Tax=Terrihabitans sp. B22-R8 TaxID=3425128 RepID=UPI00403CD2E2